MKEFMGYPFEGHDKAEQPRELPLCEIEGTSFYVDIRHHELREVGNQANRLGLGATREEYGFHHFYYDTRSKSFYLGDTSQGVYVPEHVRLVMVPPLSKLDPIGLALRQGHRADYYGDQSPILKLITLGVEQRKRKVQKKGRRIG
ncbi:hypothetical protein [Pedobacter frigoris]|uniref:hypothetical protein n=1 Tax=Pedobacter frigoris TaxID=2571272 RepID=UPI002930395C|nr:hypothetical protein [Pedobacter frigoris]